MRRIARENDLSEFTRALVNHLIKAAACDLQLGDGDRELSRDTIEDALQAVANQLWHQIVRAMVEAHPDLDMIG